jgi:hypothetical protein
LCLCILMYGVLGVGSPRRVFFLIILREFGRTRDEGSARRKTATHTHTGQHQKRNPPHAHAPSGVRTRVINHTENLQGPFFSTSRDLVILYCLLLWAHKYCTLKHQTSVKRNSCCSGCGSDYT